MQTETGKNGGRYYIVSEDLKLPSVTTILGNMTDKSGIEKWKARVGEKQAELISNNSADRGTFMHELNERYMFHLVNSDINNGILKKTFEDVLAKPEMTRISNENKENGKNLFLKFVNNNTFNRVDKLILQEEALWSKRGGGYAGRVDKVAMIDGKLKIVDYKSSRKPKKEDWIENYKMQGAAYAVAYYDQYKEMPEGVEIWIANDVTDQPQIFELNQQGIKHWFEKFYELVKGYHQKFHK